jgi:hypothetical protein
LTKGVSILALCAKCKLGRGIGKLVSRKQPIVIEGLYFHPDGTIERTYYTFTDGSAE